MEKKDNSKRYIAPIFIGQGAFSQVYRVWDSQKDCHVVRKEISNLQLARREAELLRQARHPLFPEYLDYWQNEEKGILIMEYVAGEKVSSLLARRNALSLDTSINIALEVASGLLYLHEQERPIIFRDLKPDNLMIRQDGRVKLLDMGCACYIEDGRKEIAGTPEFGAPEQFQVGKTVGPYSDIYALGKLLHMLIEKKYESLEAKMKRSFLNKCCVLHGKCPREYRAITRIISACTKEDYGERISDMRELIRILSDVKSNKKGSKKHFDTVIYQKNVRKKAQSS